MAPFYVLCAENGILIKANLSFLQAQALLKRYYFKGYRIVYRADTLKEAQYIALDFAAQQVHPVKIPTDIQPNELILFKNYPSVIDPMVF